MTVQEQIREDMGNAMKNRDTEKLSLLRFITGEFGRCETKDVSDEEALKIIRKASDNAKELGNQGEVDILDKYLPQMYSEDNIRNMINGMIEINGYSEMRDMGKVMAEIKSYPDSALIDGTIASKIAKEILSQ